MIPPCSSKDKVRQIHLQNKSSLIKIDLIIYTSAARTVTDYTGLAFALLEFFIRNLRLDF